MFTWLTKVLSGKYLNEYFGMGARTIFVRTIWLSVVFSLIIFGISWLGKYSLGSGGFPSYESWMPASLAALFWAVYTALRAEFVSKYMHLIELHDKLGEWVLRSKTDSNLYYLDENALNFAASCLSYHLQSHSAFHRTLTSIVAHVAFIQFHYPEYFASINYYYPEIVDYLRQSKAREVNWLDEYGSLVNMEKVMDEHLARVGPWQTVQSMPTSVTFNRRRRVRDR